MQNIDFKKAGLSYTIGSFFNKGMAFFTVPIFTRLLSIDDYGTVSTYNSWVSMASVVLSMSLYMAVRQACIEFPQKIEEYLSTVIIFTAIVSGTVLLLCVFVGHGDLGHVFLPMMCIIQSCAAALIEDYSMYLMMRYRYRMRTALMVLPNLISVVAAVFVIQFVMDSRLYLGRILPTVFVTSAFGVFVAVSVLRNSRRFDKGFLRHGLAFSLPLIAHGAALTVLSQSDRTMITAFIGEDKTAVYSVVYNFSMIATALSAALEGIWQPWYLERIRSHKDEDISKINEMMKAYALFMAMIMCGVILVAPEILRLLASKPYWEGVLIIPPIVLANLVTFIYTFYVSVEHFHKKTKAIAFNTLIAAGSNILLNYIFIPMYGYEAAAYTTIASYAISLVIHYIQARQLETRISGLTIFAKEFLMVLAATGVYYWALDCWIIRWGAAVVLAGIVMTSLLKKYGNLLKR